MKTLFIPVLLGTAREGRRSITVAQFLCEEVGSRPDTEVMLVDIRDHLRSMTLPPDDPGGADEHETEWKRIMARADGLIIVTPEYNRGYPGELKLLLDSLEEEYVHKPLLVAGVSSGLWGGRHVTEHLRSVAGALRMVTVGINLYFPKAKELLDEQGVFQNREEHRKRLAKPLEEFFWYAKALKAAREGGKL